MKILRRTEAGGFPDTDAIPLDDVSSEHLRPVSEAVRQLFQFEVGEDAVKAIGNGRPINLWGAHLPGVNDGQSVAIVHEGRLLAVYRVKDERLLADRVMGS
jgi:tRNA U55 pseudouridine synthase TruB